ncbi:MAG: serpin family protein [Planctomycetaceae bacterium]
MFFRETQTTMQSISRILIGIVLIASVSSNSSCAEEKRILKVVEKATVFDVKSLKPIGKLEEGDEVEVVKSFQDKDKEQWLEVISTRKESVRGYLRAKKCAPLTESVTASVGNEVEPRQIMLPQNPAGVTDLGFRILRSAPKDQVNPAVCPYGIWSNTRFWLRAAKGETLARLEKQLGLQLEKDDGPRIPSNPSFRSADRLLRSREIEIKPSYLNTASQWNLSILESKFDEPARVEVNSWIEKWSMDRIREFFTKDQWNPDAKLIFVNVACLDAEWVSKFDKASTQAGTFNTKPGETVTAEMMIQQSTLRWFSSEKLDAMGVVLPYRANDLAAIIFVPNKIDGIAGLMEHVDSNAVDDALTNAKNEEVVLLLPRVELEGSLNLFEQLDLSSVLPAEPDFSEMTDAETTISDFQQRIHLTVDEDGTRAAAATSSTIVASAVGEKEPKIVQADRPFLLLVVHEPSHTLLFATQINQPVAPPKDAAK